MRNRFPSLPERWWLGERYGFGVAAAIVAANGIVMFVVDLVRGVETAIAVVLLAWSIATAVILCGMQWMARRHAETEATADELARAVAAILTRDLDDMPALSDRASRHVLIHGGPTLIDLIGRTLAKDIEERLADQ